MISMVGGFEMRVVNQTAAPMTITWSASDTAVPAAGLRGRGREMVSNIRRRYAEGSPNR
jgi:hypothetical protein